MEDRIEDRWKDPDRFKKFFDPFREMFRPASAELVRAVLSEDVSPKRRILEIGSGMGELCMLVPEYKKQILQTEQSKEVVRAHKEFDPRANIQEANVYSLPFKDGSFDVVVGHSVFDTLSDLNNALGEVKRVLVEKGKFIHFLDCHASANTFFHKYVPQGIIPFPYWTIDSRMNLWYEVGLQLIEKQKAIQTRKRISNRLQGLFDKYIEIPEVMYCAGKSDPRFDHLQKEMSNELDSSGVERRILKYNDEFGTNIENNLKQNNYTILELGKREASTIAPRNGKHSNHPGKNFFHNDVGLAVILYDSKLERELGQTKVKVISSYHVVRAMK